MGIVDRLRNRVEPFIARLGLLPTPDPARRPSITPPPPYTKHVLYMVIVASILNEVTLPPPFFQSR